VRLDIAGLNCIDNYKWITWTGEIGKTTFIVDVPADAAAKTYIGSASIRLNDCEIAKMSFLVRVGRAEPRVEPMPSTTATHRKAFASYASEDREAVLERVQGMEVAWKGLDVFVDVMSLRSGQNWQPELTKHISEADVFYLFWCRHARQSEWVSREWRLALQAKGLEFIDPVPLESPDKAPPPQELASKHFNDPVLAFIVAAGGHLG
jgi:TIR domain